MSTKSSENNWLTDSELIEFLQAEHDGLSDWYNVTKPKMREVIAAVSRAISERDSLARANAQNQDLVDELCKSYNKANAGRESFREEAERSASEVARLTAEVLRQGAANAALQDAVMESDMRACRVLKLAEKWELYDGQLRVVMRAFAQEIRTALSPATAANASGVSKGPLADRSGSEVGK